jgi:hypothetical protein
MSGVAIDDRQRTAAAGGQAPHAGIGSSAPAGQVTLAQVAGRLAIAVYRQLR